MSQTDSLTAEGYRGALSASIASLADPHDLIDRTQAQKIALAELLEQTLKPYAAVREDRIRAAGPDVELKPRLALSLHELVTSASRYGAPSSRSGQVELLWEVLSDDAGRWRERGGPEVREPAQKGFGLRLVTKVLRNAQV